MKPDDYPYGREIIERIRETGLVNVPVKDASVFIHADEFVTLDVTLVLTRAQFRALFDEPEEFAETIRRVAEGGRP